jgi:hypothetical protein
VNFDICYRPCMIPFPEIPKQDLRVPRLVDLQQQLYLLVDFSSFYGELHDLVTFSSLFRNLNQRRIEFMQVLNHQICKQRATKTNITSKMGYNYDHLSSLCTFVAHVGKINFTRKDTGKPRPGCVCWPLGVRYPIRTAGLT